jgi:hypothetical protein
LKNCDMKIIVLAIGGMDPPRRRLPADLVLVRLHRLQPGLGLQLVALEHSLLSPRLEHRLQLHLELQPLLPLVLLQHHRHLVALVLQHHRPVVSLERQLQLPLHLGLLQPLRVVYLEVLQLLAEVSLGVIQVSCFRRLLLFSRHSVRVVLLVFVRLTFFKP